MKRINKYLNSSDMDLSNVTHDTNMNGAVVMKNANLSWGSPGIYSKHYVLQLIY